MERQTDGKREGEKDRQKICRQGDEERNEERENEGRRKEKKEKKNTLV